MNEKQGTLYIISTGPGGSGQTTLEARQALSACSVIVGYGKYIEDLGDLVAGKEIRTSSMTQEIERCNQALDLAKEGRDVALISNGDVNVYGMGSLAWELADERGMLSSIDIVSLPGITSLLAAAARAGAPISQDFAVVSLSDRLTPIEVIERRLEAALAADFVIGVYNPLSGTRKRPYELFLDLIARHRLPFCPIFVAKNLGRAGEQHQIMTVESLRADRNDAEGIQVDMSTLLIVGNSATRILDCREEKKMLTPRGYLNKYDVEGAKLRKSRP